MCGIVGLLIKNPELRDQLGALMVPMLIGMTERGPDSAGLAVYTAPVSERRRKLSLYSGEHAGRLDRTCSAGCGGIRSQAHEIAAHGNHAVLTTAADPDAADRPGLRAHAPEVAVLSVGQSIDLYKDVGAPAEIAARYRFRGADAARMWWATRAWPPSRRSRRRTRIRSPRAAIFAWCTTARCPIRIWCASAWSRSASNSRPTTTPRPLAASSNGGCAKATT